jgi:hypothetical protein
MNVVYGVIYVCSSGELTLRARSARVALGIAAHMGFQSSWLPPERQMQPLGEALWCGPGA